MGDCCLQITSIHDVFLRDLQNIKRQYKLFVSKRFNLFLAQFTMLTTILVYRRLLNREMFKRDVLIDELKYYTLTTVKHQEMRERYEIQYNNYIILNLGCRHIYKLFREMIIHLIKSDFRKFFQKAKICEIKYKNIQKIESFSEDLGYIRSFSASDL